MEKKNRGNTGNPQNRRSNISLAPLTPDQAVDAIFQIKPSDVKRIVATRPGKQSRKK